MSSKTLRNIREPLKKPRPLKSASLENKVSVSDPKDTVTQKSRDEILADLEILNVSISNCSFDEVTVMDISRMCAILKKRGEELDSFHKDAVDRYYCTIRNACREERLDIVSRVKLLEAIECRARGWKRNENLDNYFNQKISELEHRGVGGYASGVTSPTIPYPIQNQNIAAVPVPLAAGEILRSSGKFEKPTKITGKNYFKDEIIIRNSDSGKVNPGARDRLVQITGPHEDAISHAKLLVEDTIRRNASPIRDSSDVPNYESNKDQRELGISFSALDNNQNYMKKLQHSYSMGDASIKEYSLGLQIGGDIVTLTGTNSKLLQTARCVLEDYFSAQNELEKQLENFIRQPSPDSNFHRFDLKRQLSLKSNMENCMSWTSDNLRRDSLSPLSSSDDDVIKEDRTRGLVRVNADPTAYNYLNHVDIKSQNSVIGNSSQMLTKNRSASLPNDMVQAVFPELESLPNDEVLSSLLSSSETEVDPPIPPPSYKKSKYSREFMLKCAKSPFSHNQPDEYPRIHQNYKDIICQSPVMFDPDKYEESWKESWANEIK